MVISLCIVAGYGVGAEHVRVPSERVQVRDRANRPGAAGGQEEVLHAKEERTASQVRASPSFLFTF